MSRQTFELNGRSYDALTGAMLGNSGRPQTNAAPTTTSRPAANLSSRLQSQPATRTASVDGFVSKPAAAITQPSVPSQPAQPAVTVRSQIQPKHVSPRQPQPTKTLVRRGVRMPSFGAAAPATATQPAAPAAAAVTAPAAIKLQPVRGVAPTVIPKMSSSAINPRRAQAAMDINRSGSVQRFGDISGPAQPMRTAMPATSVSGIALAPKSAPAQPAATPQNFQLATTPQPVRQMNNFSAPTRRPARPAVPTPANKTPQADDDQDIFTRALAEASSHEEAAPNIKTRKGSKRSKTIMGFAAMAAVFIGLFGFVAYQNRDDLRLQVASAKAGFPASAPLYKPDGFALASMKYTTGSVNSVYKHGNNQDITITQKKSNWDSQTLLENFVATSANDYQGFQSNGRTVYVYGKGNATWVNGGVWYQIKATGNLTSEQLVRIAASM